MDDASFEEGGAWRDPFAGVWHVRGAGDANKSDVLLC